MQHYYYSVMLKIGAAAPLTGVALLTVDAGDVTVEQLDALAGVWARTRRAVGGRASQRVAIVTRRAAVAAVANRVVLTDALAWVDT